MTEGLTKIILLFVTMAFLVAVISVLAAGAVSAKDIAADGTSFFDNGTRSEPINTYKLSDGSMPVAAIAAILRRERDSASSFHCEICGITAIADDIGDCLKNHLSGRGILTFVQDARAFSQPCKWEKSPQQMNGGYPK